MIIGGHVSAAGGCLNALTRAQERGFKAIQIHPTGPQSWAGPTTTDSVAAEFKGRAPECGVDKAFFHNIYLANFASAEERVWQGAIRISVQYLELAHKMGVGGVVTHLGSHKGSGFEAVLPDLIARLQRMLAEAPAGRFLIENTAGAGGTIGRSLVEIEQIINGVGAPPERLGVCIDTCHAFASGIPIQTNEGWAGFMTEFEQRLGLKRLACMHLNDSKGEFDSNKDRHQNIGDGMIGLEGFRHIVTDSRLQDVPGIMEVPGVEHTGPDAANREKLEALQ